ncbi:DNA-3-methyladenine glycosylase I [Treponema brennaborense]|uniref:DNA-3-methyladenine glycosylase I n=1 Tax=Treponema brennaborense (strain DSM 12168 / CIP 105900 / DD5/3) TaxID=906968 RepID=F4LPQ7_TREBD|nr:DNA-3-methyladenine glycosylase I [Treponema brennaborense]AEE17053.1 DNA-3-methyladenine glycosylase I [Treponema brennaborense DSM 12168]
MERCKWCCDDGIVQKYHDEEWGMPLHNDRKHFEFISMEVMQCGLNWTMMLNKREIFKKCFSDFDFEKISQYTESDIVEILNHDGMIKSRRKIEAIIGNAAAFRNIIQEYGSFNHYIWSFSNNESLIYLKHQQGQPETKNDLSDKISIDLKKRGFKYLGSITVYAHLQACGIINDHTPTCFMYNKLVRMGNVRYIDD